MSKQQDKKRKAKPKGWRYKTADKENPKYYKRPTAKEIESGKKVYYEARATKSDANQSKKFEGGGDIEDNKKYALYLRYWDAEVFKDDYNEGEGDHVNSFGEKENKSFNSPNELMDYIKEHILYSSNLKNEDFYIMDGGRISTSMLVDEYNSEASKSLIKKWEKGGADLYSAHYNFYVSLIDEKVPSAEELSKLLGIGMYKDGGGVPPTIETAVVNTNVPVFEDGGEVAVNLFDWIFNFK